MGTPDLPEGCRLPAEWERHEATWMSWPHAGSASWPGESNAKIVPGMGELVDLIARHEPVYLNVPPGFEKEVVLAEIAPERREQIRFVEILTDESWCRDHSPIFLLKPNGQRLAVTWKFNAWGERYALPEDAKAAKKIAHALGGDHIERALTLEGGGFESNGAGLVVASRKSVVNENRNPGLNEAEIETELRKWFCADDWIWIDAQLEGDDTDGHVDNIARFVSAKRMVVVCPESSSQPNYQSLRANFSLLEAECTRRGIELLELPTPAEPVVVDGLATPASYANFYITNGSVIVPVFGDSNDDAALSVIAEQFRDRETVAYDARALVWGQGACHCSTCQVPAEL